MNIYTSFSLLIVVPEQKEPKFCSTHFSETMNNSVMVQRSEHSVFHFLFFLYQPASPYKLVADEISRLIFLRGNLHVRQHAARSTSIRHTHSAPAVCSPYDPLGNERGRCTRSICRIIARISSLPITAAYKRSILS